MCREDNGYKPLHLADPNCQNIRHPTPEQLAMEWRKKSLHGQHPLVQDQPNMDKEASNLRHRRGEKFPETEGFVVAIQDKVIWTRNYQKHILRQNVDDKCRLRKYSNETIEYIIDGCRMLAQREYTRRQNHVCGIIHQQIALHLELLQDWKSYYRYVQGTSSWEWTLSLVMRQDHLDRLPCRTPVFTERGRKRPPPWTLPGHGFFLASLP